MLKIVLTTLILLQLRGIFYNNLSFWTLIMDWNDEKLKFLKPILTETEALSFMTVIDSFESHTKTI